MKERIKYIKDLLNDGIEVDLHSLKTLLKQKNIKIDEVVFKECEKKEHLTLISIDSFDEVKRSVNISLCEKSWIELLPSIYQENDFLKRFLYGFQVTMLTQKERVEHSNELFIPEKTDAINWLASWFGVSFGVAKEDAQRKMLYKIIELYKIRGTKEYLIEIIKIFTNIEVTIIERYVPEYIIKENYSDKSDVDFTKAFTVRIKDKISNDIEEEKKILQSIKIILNREKPAFSSAYIDYRFLHIKEIIGDIIISGNEVVRDNYKYDDIIDFHAEKKEIKIKKLNDYGYDEF